MDPVLFLTTEDDTLRILMQQIAKRYREVQDRIDRNRAALISNAVWGAVKKK